MCRPVEGTDAWVALTSRADGDARQLEGVAGRRWVVARQVHGSGVAVVEAPTVGRAGRARLPAGEGGGRASLVADALVTASPDVCLAVLGADCALVGLASAEGVVAAVHCGWRGLLAGVVERAVEAMRSLGAGEVRALTGPCIHAECYEFGAFDLAVVASAFGDEVRSTASSGEPALDLPLALRRSLDRAAVVEVGSLGGCTACDARWYSHRARGELARHALAIWREPADYGGRG